MKRLLIVINILLLASVTALPVAATTVSETFSSSYVVKEDDSTQITYAYTVENKEGADLVNKYTAILPYTDAQIDSVLLNGSKRQYEESVSAGLTRVSVGINPPLKAGQKATLKLLFSTKSVVVNSGSLKRIYIPGVSQTLSVASREVKVPDSYPSLFSTSFNDSDQKSFTTSDHGPIYLAYGDTSYGEFRLVQNLHNSADRKKETRFLFPNMSDLNRVYFLNYDGEELIKTDSSGNAELSATLDSKESLSINMEGVVINDYLASEGKDFLKETETWDYTNESYRTFESFSDSDKKVEGVFRTIVDRFDPLPENKYRRRNGSRLLHEKSLTEIQYSDLMVSALRKLGIPAMTVVGVNPATSDDFNVWVLYKDLDRWEVADPFTADLLGTDSLAANNKDRLVVYIFDGDEDEEIFDFHFVENEGNYVQYDMDTVNRGFVNDELDYDFFILETKIPFNAKSKLRAKFKNNSSFAINLESISDRLLELKIDESGWVLPGQEREVSITGLVIGGGFTKRDVDLLLRARFAGSNRSHFDSEVSSTLSAVPTIQSFLPVIYIGILGGAIVGGYLFYTNNKKKIKRFSKKIPRLTKIKSLKIIYRRKK